MSRHRVHVPAIPEGLIPPGANKSDAYKYLVDVALKANLNPQPFNSATMDAITVFFPPKLLAETGRIAKESNLANIQSAFTGLAIAGVRHLSALAENERAEQKPEITSPFSGRPEQDRYYKGLIDGLNKKKIVFAEGTTGIGKGRALMAAAVDRVRNGTGPVVVAAPSLQVLAQLYQEYQKLDVENNVGIANIRLAIIPGKQEFVNDIKLGEFLAESGFLAHVEGAADLSEIDSEVAEWYKGGGITSKSDLPLVNSLKSVCSESPRWLMDDLREIGSALPVDDFTLKSGDACASSEYLDRYISALKEHVDIMLMTHTMLALMCKNGWVSIPQPKCIFIDEAHQFETSVASVNSTSLSLHSLRTRLAKYQRENGLKSGSLAARAQKLLRKLVVEVGSLETESSNVRFDELRGKPEYGRVVLLLQEINEAMSSKIFDKVSSLKESRSDIRRVIRSLESGSSDRTDVIFSPSYRYPSIQSGPSRIHGKMTAVWNSAPEGAVLASATLFVPDEYGNSKADYVREILNIPLERMYAPNPVIDREIYEAPTLYLPPMSRCESLSPPSVKDENFESLEDEWISNLAREAQFIVDSAVGGTLILTTSYAQINKLNLALQSYGVAQQRIYPHTRGAKLSASIKDFRQLHADGHRPILLALGGAWTGTDLTQKDMQTDEVVSPEVDTLLTDLIILRFPIGLNRSGVMLRRIATMSTAPIIKEALLMFKQGLGRLIRRKGLKNRRLWILDGRVCTIAGEWKGMDGFVSSANRILRDYKDRKTFWWN